MNVSDSRDSQEATPPTEAPASPSPPRGAHGSDATGRTAGCAVVGIGAAILLPIVLYFGFFAALIIDESVTKTRYLAPSNFPRPVVEAIEFIYAPLFMLTQRFFE